jgi:hypothetical protein
MVISVPRSVSGGLQCKAPKQPSSTLPQSFDRRSQLQLTISTDSIMEEMNVLSI